MIRGVVTRSTGVHEIPACPGAGRQCRCPECCQRWLAHPDAATAQQEVAL